MPIYKNIFMMASRSKTGVCNIYMAVITEQDEKLLDTGISLMLTKNKRTYNVDKNKVICYGKIDFTTNSDDYKVISGFKYLDNCPMQGIIIPSNYDFATHSCTVTNRIPQYTETFNPAVLAQYAYACLNKPERVVIFKE